MKREKEGKDRKFWFGSGFDSGLLDGKKRGRRDGREERRVRGM